MLGYTKDKMESGSKIQQRSNSTKGVLLKIVISLSLFIWMVDRGLINLGDLKVFFGNASLVLSAFLFWLVGPIVLSAIRWKIILKNAGFLISGSGAIRLQLIGVFFSSALPGSLGGDVMKSYFIVKQNKDASTTLALFSILFDRIVGMFGLFLIGGIALALNPSLILNNASLLVVGAFVVGYLGCFVLLIVAMRYAYLRWKNSETQGKGLLAVVKRTILRFSIFASSMRNLMFSIILSFFAQLLSFVFFYYLYISIQHHPMWYSISDVAAIFPLGMMTTTLPISPGGLGVGHFAFSQLFDLAHLSGGATIFNAYFISQLLLNLLGVFSYITITSRDQRRQVGIANA